MDLRQLNTFLQVAELGSLSKAAKRLHIVQPALSRQIGLLEDELKVTLFNRHGRGMALTPAGEILRARAHAILRQVEDARADLAQEAGTLRGRVVFGLPPTVGSILTTRLVERFLAVHPAVTLRIVHAFSGYLLDWLQSGEMDVAIAYGGSQAAGVRQSPLLRESLHFVTASGSTKPLGRKVRFADVAKRRLVLPGLSHGLRRQVEQQARLRALDLHIVVEADDLQVLKDLALKGLGATILPLSAVQEDVAARRLEAALIVEPLIMRTLVVAKPLARPISHAAAQFAAMLSDEVAGMVQAGLWSGELLMNG